MAEKIIDKILWIDGFYPFSLKFDIDKSIEKHKTELEKLEFDPTAKSIFMFSKYFNTYFKDICAALEDIFKNSTIDKSTFIYLLVSDLNRTEVIISEDSKQALLSVKWFDGNMPANLYIQKSEFQNNTEPVWGLIDTAIDTANLNLNYLNYVHFNKNKEKQDEISQVNVIKNLVLIGSSFNVIKQSYDKIIWRGGDIEFKDSVVKLKSNQQNLMLDNVALTRLIRNISSTQMELESDLEKYMAIKKLYHTTRHFQIIKSIEEYNNEMIFNYKTKSKNPTFSFIYFTSPILTYYPFYYTEKITQFNDLTILDLVNLFSLLHDLIIELPMPKYNDTGVVDLEKFKLFNPKIKKSSLVDYFKRVSKYSENQIEVFINLLKQTGDTHNLYLYSIYEKDNYYFFSHSTIKRANMLYLVDKWLEIGKCDLAERGFKFENYIKFFLLNEKLNEFAKFDIVEHSKFSFLDKNNVRFEEEIDLVIKTNTSIIIAEIKCTTYPLEPIDFYNSYQTTKKAVNQVKRKAQYIECNWDKFEHLLGKKDDRSIHKIVIVNFPHYAGRIIDDIPITDFYLFLSYFKTGKLTNLKIERNKEIQVNDVLYYNSVPAFEKNFEPFFKNPIPIQELISRQKIEEFEVTLKGTEPKTIAERVVYIERTHEED